MELKVLTLAILLIFAYTATARTTDLTDPMDAVDYFVHSKLSDSRKEVVEIDVDLDAHPRKRWDPVIEKFGEPIRILINRIVVRLPSYLKPAFELVLEESIGDPEIQEEYEQYAGMAEKLNIPIVDVLLYNFLYEVTDECFGIVAQNEQGDIIIGRNLDFPMVLRNVAYQANFYKDGKLLYKAMMLAGFNGSFTAMKPGKFAVTLNARPRDYFLRGVIPALFRVNGVHNPGSLLREAMEEADTYEEALDILQQSKLATKVYYVVSGTEPNQGIIITRNENEVEDLWRLDADSDTDWALYITNFDRDDPYLDKIDEGKTAKTREILRTVTKEKLDEENVMSEILQSPPMFNPYSIYSTVVNAKKGYFHSAIYN